MSLTINYFGTASGIIFSSVPNVTTGRGSPPIPDFSQGINSITPGISSLVNLDDISLTWSNPNNIDASPLQGRTINSLISDTSISIKRSIKFTVSGIQFSNNTGNPNISLNIWTESGGNFDITETFQMPTINSIRADPDRNISYCNTSGCTNITVSPEIPVSGITIIPWNKCSGVVCKNHHAQNITFTYEINAVLTVICGGDNLETGFCPLICNRNLQTCFNAYKQYCLVDTDSSGDLNIFSSEGCQSFIPRYIRNVGPNNQIDTLLSPACIAKYSNFGSLEKCTTPNCQKICACHLSSTLYNTLYSSVVDKFKGFAFIAEKKECLFPLCVNTEYTTENIGKVCPIPDCINIVDIENSGTIEGGTTVNQKGNCVNIAGGGNGGGDTTPTDKSWIDKHWVWIVIGVAILIVLIIVILIIIASENNKKKPPRPNFV